MIRNIQDISAVKLLSSRSRGALAPRAGQGKVAANAPRALISLLGGFALILFLLLPALSLAVTPVNGDRIINTATFSSAETAASSSSVTVTVAAGQRTRSTLEFLKYAPGIPGATGLSVATTYYRDGSGSYIAVQQPVTVGIQKPLDLSAPVPLLPSKIFHTGEPLFIRVIDLDQNLDPTRAETIITTVTDPKTGDSETLQLAETGPDTGVFIGCIQTTSATSVSNNGALSVVESSSITAKYIDIVDGTDISADAALVDPFGIVFDTVTGQPVNGATVELLNSDGTPATVYGDNGLSSNTYPNSVISGGTAVDQEGNQYTFTPGSYRFPFVSPGNYILRVTPPVTYSSPSTVSTARIQVLTGGPFTILEPGSRGEVFSVSAGPAIRVDIPIDPKIGTLWLRKSAGKSAVSAGDYLSYDISLENTDQLGTLFSTIVIDKLPPGFRYQKGSARLNGFGTADPDVSPDGSTLTFRVGTIGPKAAALIRYVVSVGAGAQPGTAINTASSATNPAVASNIATASVIVQEPFMQSRTLIMGRVIVGTCSDNIEENRKGMEGIGIYLEDGTFVISDKRGLFHFEGVRPGTHVVQLDLDSIPEGYRILPCEQNSRFAGRAYSQFVDLQGGTMWRTDFHLGRTALSPPPADNIREKALAIGKSAEAAPLQPVEEKKGLPVYHGEITLEMISSQSGEIIDYHLPLQAHTVPLRNLALTVALPEGVVYLPGSSNFNGTYIPDPEVTPGKLVYPLEDATDKWLRELQFRAVVDKSRSAGELETKARLRFDSSISAGIETPEVTNILSLTKEEQIVPLPLFVFRPHFPTFGAELSDADRMELDALVATLADKIIKRIDVTGHTDNVRIAPRSRGVYANNNALSLARAKSVGRYLATALKLSPEALFLNGSGQKKPLVSNRTAAGRALNRRVEVRISAVQRFETTHLKIIKERSGLEKMETIGGPFNGDKELKPLLTPPLIKNEPLTVQSASNGTEEAVSAADTPLPASETEARQPKKDPPQAKATVNHGERVELLSALSEGVVHYRIKLAEVKEPLKNVSVTLTTPKSILYMSGTTTLSGPPAADPEIKESTIAYHFANLPEEKQFDLRLQGLIDGDDQSENPASSVTVVISDSDGKALKSYTATTSHSDTMEEINRTDTTVEIPKKPAEQVVREMESPEDYHEQVEKINRNIPPAPAGTGTVGSGSHVSDEPGILSPADGSIVVNRINAVRVVLDSALTPALLLDGKEISSERIGFSMKDSKTEKSLYTYIGLDFGEAGEHVLQLKGLDPFGVNRFSKSARITRSGEITVIRVVSTEGNIADGKSPVKIRVKLFDNNNNPVASDSELALKGGDLRPLPRSGNKGLDAANPMVSVSSDGWISFQPVTNSGLYRVQLAYNKASVEVETYVKPKMRDWILVGLAEGTAGYSTATGHMENLKTSGAEEHFYDDKRLAFYAKGTIKGEWLLTISFDSAKQSTGPGGNALFQNIDPNAYYTLYGDATAQGYEASSSRKLFLKVERDQFYAMYGDYDTGLVVTELSRYSRRLNGVKTEFRSNGLEVTAFGSETGQSFIKDEIRGDGTSGLYRTSRTGIVINSEKITIQSRDRFHSETVTDSRPMSRFIDYSIDYDNGTIFFKGPVASRNEKLDPIYIVVDYEISNTGKDALTFGGHAGTRLLDGILKLGGSYIHEGHLSGANNLYGADAVLTLGPDTKVRTEIATTDSDTTLLKKSGNAFLTEITHSDKTVDAKAYYRQQGSGFGLGQQQGSESATRKFGAEAACKLDNSLTLSSQAYRQYNLADGAVRDFIEGLATYNDKQFSYRGGLRYANDTLADASSASSVIATLGTSWKTFDQRLTLRLDHDQSFFNKNNNTDFPTRTILGADYQATRSVLIFAQEEMTFGAAEDTNTTRIGMKSTPWSGGALSSTIVNDMKENSDRTFANVGLAQKWQLTPSWTVDGGLDHSETIRKKTGYQLNANVPPASGGEDFTALSLGANYLEKQLAWSNRVEYRNSDIDDKWGLITGVVNEQGLNWGWTGRLQLLHAQSSGAGRTDAELRMGIAYRPPVTRWIVLDRLDLVTTDEKSASFSATSKRIINNLNANYRPDKKTQLSIQYGAKYVLENIDAQEYSGFTNLLGLEGRYDLTKEWDLGMRSSMLHSWNNGQMSYSFGPSVGYNIADNAWLSLGYNLFGYYDKDFSSANYTSQGPFVQFRFKFDQNSVKDGLKALNQ